MATTWRAMGRADIARHVIRLHVTEDARVQNVFAGNMTWQAISARAYLDLFDVSVREDHFDGLGGVPKGRLRGVVERHVPGAQHSSTCQLSLSRFPSDPLAPEAEPRGHALRHRVHVIEFAHTETTQYVSENGAYVELKSGRAEAPARCLSKTYRVPAPMRLVDPRLHTTASCCRGRAGGGCQVVIPRLHCTPRSRAAASINMGVRGVYLSGWVVRMSNTPPPDAGWVAGRMVSVGMCFGHMGEEGTNHSLVLVLMEWGTVSGGWM